MNSTTHSILDVAVTAKRVIVRVDMNVPMHDGRISDDTRIRRAAPTLQDLAKRGAKVIVLSHFGRPKGKDASLSLAPIREALAHIVEGVTVHFVEDCIGDRVQNAIQSMANGEILLCENVRFYEQEEAGDAVFARSLADLGDMYVNDAFSCSHRAHASITGIAQLLPSYFGMTMLEEVAALHGVFSNPTRPVAALVGGSKVSTKMELLEHLVETMDVLMIGGGMANTFLYAQGHEVGASLCEKDLQSLALKILKKAHEHHCRILLPVDVTVSQKFAAHAQCRVVAADEIPEGWMALDVGVETVRQWQEAMHDVKTLVWNGPVGAFEIAPFDHGTVAMARQIAALTGSGKLVAVAGGGDTVSALSHAGLTDAMSYVSTAGGAFLEWLEGKELPGVAVVHKQEARLAS
ncbi:MAG: phosphoglycerate kinase [Alphaproteobacteria bacterium]|nr:MAG: phosphoglycerate kinase [Alphaproteobacteria bacterium]